MTPPLEDELVGIAEIAQMAGVSTVLVSTWRKRHADSFPAVIGPLKGGPVFRRSDVAAWLDERGHDIAGGAGAGHPRERDALFGPTRNEAEIRDRLATQLVQRGYEVQTELTFRVDIALRCPESGAKAVVEVKDSRHGHAIPSAGIKHQIESYLRFTGVQYGALSFGDGAFWYGLNEEGELFHISESRTLPSGLRHLCEGESPLHTLTEPIPFEPAPNTEGDLTSASSEELQKFICNLVEELTFDEMPERFAHLDHRHLLATAVVCRDLQAAHLEPLVIGDLELKMEHFDERVNVATTNASGTQSVTSRAVFSCTLQSRDIREPKVEFFAQVGLATWGSDPNDWERYLPTALISLSPARRGTARPSFTGHGQRNHLQVTLGDQLKVDRGWLTITRHGRPDSIWRMVADPAADCAPSPHALRRWHRGSPVPDGPDSQVLRRLVLWAFAKAREKSRRGAGDLAWE